MLSSSSSSSRAAAMCPHFRQHGGVHVRGGEGEEGPETAVGERLVKGVSPEGMRAVTGCEGQARAGPGSGGAAFSMAGARPLLIAPSGLYSLSPAYDHPSPPVAAAKPTRGVRAHCREKAR